VACAVARHAVVRCFVTELLKDGRWMQFGVHWILCTGCIARSKNFGFGDQCGVHTMFLPRWCALVESNCFESERHFRGSIVMRSLKCAYWSLGPR
jgi:hypothetical protein